MGEFVWKQQARELDRKKREPALLMIDPYPWSAPLEDVRLKPR